MEIDTKANKVYRHIKDLTKVNIIQFAKELQMDWKEVDSALKRLEEEYFLIEIKQKRLNGDRIIEYTGKSLMQEEIILNPCNLKNLQIK